MTSPVNIFDAFAKAEAVERLMPKRHAVLKIVNRLLGQGAILEIRTPLRSRDEIRTFRFIYLSGAAFDALHRGLLPVLDIDRQGATRNINLDGVLSLAVIFTDGHRAVWEWITTTDIEPTLVLNTANVDPLQAIKDLF